MRWEHGAVLAPEQQANLSAKEASVFSSYDQLLGDYMSDVGVALTAAVAPPKELFTEFRVLVDSGEVMTDQGVVNLERGSTHYLRRSDGEHLARQGLTCTNVNLFTCKLTFVHVSSLKFFS